MENGLTNLEDLFVGNRVFQVPIYQRNYSWEKKQCEDLWDDLLYLNPEKRHYFGTILLKATDEVKTRGHTKFKVFELIDGQQRITTILILLNELINQLGKNDELKEDAEGFRESYLKSREIYKLELLGDDDTFFTNNIIENEEFPSETLTPSQKRLNDSKLFFRSKIEDLKDEKTSEELNSFLLEFKDKIDSMDVIRYTVKNESDAVLIFETVNDRGKQLTNLEKTKSFLMHSVYLSEHENSDIYLKRMNKQFSDIFKWFEEIRSTEKGKGLIEDDIQRYHFITYEYENIKKPKQTPHKYMEFLKSKVKNLYRNDENESLEYALEYTKDLRNAFFILKEIVNYNSDKNEQIAELLDKIFVLDRVAQFYPLLISAWTKLENNEENTEKYTEKQIERLLNIIEVAVFRIFAIGKKRTNTGETLLYNLAYDIRNNDLKYNSLENQLLEGLINRFGNDKKFMDDLSNEYFYLRIAPRDIKYLLFEYEKLIREESGEGLDDIPLNTILKPVYEIEHIWPNNPAKLHLDEEMENIHDFYKDKLGNLTIASKKWNSKWGNSPFNVKKKNYGESVLRVQRTLCSCEKWDDKEIEERESQLISFAKSRWGIPGSVVQKTFDVSIPKSLIKD